jgi:ubiquinone/menaquinone biosynthesis C-methylase UbiE
VLRCRIGRTARAIARSCPDAEVVGLDSCERRLETARHLSALAGLRRIQYVRAELDAMPWEDGRFDAVVVMLGLHEMADDLRAAALHESRRVLAAGGWLLAMEPDRPAHALLGRLADLWFRYREEEWARKLLVSGLTNELDAGGLAVVRKEALGAGFFQLVAAQKPA